MTRLLDAYAFADHVGALQSGIRGDRRIPTTVADGLCATLGGVMRDVGFELRAASPMALRRVDPGEGERTRQARMCGGADPFFRATR